MKYLVAMIKVMKNIRISYTNQTAVEFMNTVRHLLLWINA